jgi:uncharacterized repeat protein (TIGR01451 family)
MKQFINMMDHLKSKPAKSPDHRSPGLLQVLAACLFAGVLLAMPTVSNAQARACGAGEVQQALAIPAGSWVAGSQGPVTYTVGTGINAITVTYSDIGANFVAGAPLQTTSGGLANVVESRHTGVPANSTLSTQRISFSRPVNGLSLIGTDVDFDTTTFQDQVVVRANGTILPTSMTGGPRHTINLATGTATATTSFNCANTDASCNVTSGFNVNGILNATQEFRTGPSHNGGTQYVGATSFGWCAPKLSNITLSKTWVNATVNDAVTVSAAGATPALTSLASVAGTANETDTGALQTVLVGSALTLSENFTAGAAANYAPTLACTGTSGLVGSNLTVGSADTAIVCTYTNTRNVANVVITKTDSKATAATGGTNNYVVTLTNQGPSAANGVIVTDTVGAGLTCPAADAVTCTVIGAGAVCPAGLTIANLTGAGITVATLPVNGALQFAYTCNVN